MTSIHPFHIGLAIGFDTVRQQRITPDVAGYVNHLTGNNQAYYSQYEYSIRTVTFSTISRLALQLDKPQNFLCAILQRNEKSGSYIQFKQFYEEGYKRLQCEITEKSKKFSGKQSDAELYEKLLAQEEAMAILFHDNWDHPEANMFDWLYDLAVFTDVSIESQKRHNRNRLPSHKSFLLLPAP